MIFHQNCLFFQQKCPKSATRGGGESPPRQGQKVLAKE
jgi:hypothetical protein